MIEIIMILMGAFLGVLFVWAWRQDIQNKNREEE